MKHFEDIWVEAEALAPEQSPELFIKDLKEKLELFNSISDEEKKAELMGAILFSLSGLSKAYNINVAAAMKFIIDEYKIDNYC